jgi:transcriptional regulator with GAF, ATPase, and Fis domain
LGNFFPQLEAEKEALHRMERRTHEALTALLTMAEVLVEAAPEEHPQEDGSVSEARRITYRLVELTHQVLGCEHVSIVRVESETQKLLPLAMVGYQPEEVQQWSKAIAEQSLKDSLAPEEIAQLSVGQVVLHRETKSVEHNLLRSGIVEVLVAPLRIGSQLLGYLRLIVGMRSMCILLKKKRWLAE